MRRFLISYQYNVDRGFGFGSLYHERTDNALPNPAAIAGARESVARNLGIDRSQVIALAVSEVSAEGEAVI